MRISYDIEANAAYIDLTDEPLAAGRQSIPCDPPEGTRAFVVMGWKDDKIVGLEVLDARARLHTDLLAQARPPGTSEKLLTLDEAYRAAFYMVLAYVRRSAQGESDAELLAQYMWSDPARWSDWQDAITRALADTDGLANPDREGLWRDRPDMPN